MQGRRWRAPRVDGKHLGELTSITVQLAVGVAATSALALFRCVRVRERERAARRVAAVRRRQPVHPKPTHALPPQKKTIKARTRCPRPAFCPSL